MRTVTNVGLIECKGLSTKHHLSDGITSTHYNIKKVFSKNDPFALEHYPTAELVKDTNDILQDGSIDLVIISSSSIEGKEIASAALGTGKSVRIL